MGCWAEARTRSLSDFDNMSRTPGQSPWEEEECGCTILFTPQHTHIYYTSIVITVVIVTTITTNITLTTLTTTLITTSRPSVPFAAVADVAWRGPHSAPSRPHAVCCDGHDARKQRDFSSVPSSV